MNEEALARIESIIDEETSALEHRLVEEIADGNTTRAKLWEVSQRLKAHEETIGRIRQVLDDNEMRRAPDQDALGRIRGLLHG